MSRHDGPWPPPNLIEPDQLRSRLSRLLPDLPPTVSEDADPRIEARLAGARAAFMDGYRDALHARLDALPRLFEKEPPQRRGFALEGAGMASVLLDAYLRGNQTLLESLLDGRSAAETTLVAIGVGWANARLHQPPDRLPKGLHMRHLHAVADGYGFHQGFFHSLRFEGRGFPGRDGQVDVSYDAGLGRALWFVYAGRAAPILRAVNKMAPNRRASLWRGAGTACAFTGCTFMIGEFAYSVFSGSVQARGRGSGRREHSEIEMTAADPLSESHFQEGVKTGTKLLHDLGSQKEETFS